MPMEVNAVVLAAGKGTRMKSDLPKVLVPVCGRPMLEYVLDTLVAAGVSRTLVVVGYRADAVRQAVGHRPEVEFVDQPEQLGTGHAVKMCVPYLEGREGPVVVLTGDSPLTQVDSLRRLLEVYWERQPACILGTLEKDDPAGLGRVVRDAGGEFVGIVEERDATPEQRRIREVNMSTYVFDVPRLLPVLARLSRDNRQGEYYVTDCPGLLKQQGHLVLAEKVLKPCEALSINNVEQLQEVERQMRLLAGFDSAPDGLNSSGGEPPAGDRP